MFSIKILSICIKMDTKNFWGILLMAMFAVIGLTACSDDEEEEGAAAPWVGEGEVH